MKGFNEALRRGNAQRLKDYFGSDGAMSGLRSIHGPLVDMALSGGGVGARKQEGSITDRRFGRDGIASEHRTIRHALRAIEQRHQDTLTAAYGNQRRWHPQVKRALLSALPDAYKDAMGAAILTARVQRGMQDPKELAQDIDDCEDVQSEATRRRKRARSVTGVQVWLPGGRAFKAIGANPSEVTCVAMTTKAMLDSAHLAFAVAMGQLEPKPIKRDKPARKVAAVVPFSAPGGW